MNVMRLFAPAKINLHLRVAPLEGGAAAADGFHPLLSWMCTVGLFDTLLFDILLDDTLLERLSAPLGISLCCDDPNLACDHTNLIVRAADAVVRTAGEGGPPSRDQGRLSMQLQKRIPAGGGLGGGSSDAARTVLGLDRLWNLRWPTQKLSEVAATLGSDVAFFCHGPSSICTGRGQIVRPIAIPSPRWVLLILPPISVPTGLVYRRFDELLSESDCEQLAAAVAIEPPWDEWARLPAEALLPKLVNDLERPAFDLHPELNRTRGDVEQTLGRIVRMSGSGSSLFTLFDEHAAADNAAAMVAARFGVRAMALPLAPVIDDDMAADIDE